MDQPKNTDEDLLALARKRFERCVDAQARSRTRAKDDIRFAAASPDDPWQWSDADKSARTLQSRPMLTINKIPQHVRQVTNDIRQNRPAIRFRPADDKADPEVADILMGLVKHIEANSDADVAYDTAAEHQVIHGLGYIRVMNDYIRSDSFDQDIFIKRVKHPFRIYLDPDIEDPAGADAMFGFVEENLSEEEFKAQYPDEDPIDWNFIASDSEMLGWYTQDKRVRVCEYFYLDDKADTLQMWEDGTTSWKSDDKRSGRPIKTRKAQKRTVQWCKLTGLKVLEKKLFPGRYVPLARVVGNEYIVEGDTITSGIVRNAKDSQRMYNVGQSAIVERIMQAPKSPYVAPADAIEGYDTIWQTANTANHSFLPYNHLDDAGNPIPSPTRIQPATVETGLNQIVMGASDDIKAETGQYDASLGQKSNETSGKAILARQREGDTSTYHYVDNLGRAVRHVGRIILSMMPEIYDTQRVARMIGEDDQETQNAQLDPQSPMALQEVQDETGAIKRIFNPFVGTYDVYATTGPSFTTRRVEAAQAMTDLTQANPALWGVIGDQLVKNMDWPGAEEMAERIKLTLIPPVQQMLDKGKGAPKIDPQTMQQMQQMQEQMQTLVMAKDQLEHALQTAHQEHADLENEVKSKSQVEMMRLQAQDQREKDKHAREIQFEIVKATQAKEQADNALRIAEMNNANSFAIAKLQAEVQLAQLQVDVAQAAEAREAEKALEGQKATEQQAETQKTDKTAEALKAMADSHKKVAGALEKLSKPKKFINDEQGNPIGVAHMD